MRVSLLLVVGLTTAGCLPWPHRIITRPELDIEVVDVVGNPVPSAQVVVVAQPGYPPFPHEVTQSLADANGRVSFAQDSYIYWIVHMHSPGTPTFAVGAWGKGYLASASPVDKPYEKNSIRLTLQTEPADANETKSSWPLTVVEHASWIATARGRAAGYTGYCPLIWTGDRPHREGKILVGPARVTWVDRRADFERGGFARYRERFGLELESPDVLTAYSDFPTTAKEGDKVWVCLDTAAEAADSVILFLKPTGS